MKERYNEIKNYKEGYEKNIFGGYIYQFGMWLPQYVWIRNYDKPYLYNKNTEEVFKTLKEINRELRLKELEIEIW